MRRRLLIAACVAVVITLVVGYAWVVSRNFPLRYVTTRTFLKDDRTYQRSRQWILSHGDLVVWHAEFWLPVKSSGLPHEQRGWDTPPPNRFSFTNIPRRIYAPGRTYSFAGIEYYPSQVTGRRRTNWGLRVPLSYCVIGSVVVTLILVANVRRRARTIAGHLCITCGYDLRATPDRCPECGAVPEKVLVSN